MDVQNKIKQILIGADNLDVKQENYQKKIDEILQNISGLSERVAVLEKEVKELKEEKKTPPVTKKTEHEEVKAEVNPPKPSAEIVKPITPPQDKIIKPQETEKTSNRFFAKAYDMGDEIVIKSVTSSGAEHSAPFICETKGKNGTISFNESSLSRNMQNADLNIFPFCNTITETTTNPRSIETTQKGKIEKLGKDWILTSKPTIKIL